MYECTHLYLCVCTHLYVCVYVYINVYAFFIMKLEEKLGITHFLIINNQTLGKFCVPIISFSGARTF